MKKEIGILIVLLIVTSCSQVSDDMKINESQVNPEPQEILSDSTTTNYFIEGEEVTKEIYDDQKDQLVEIEDTYHCATTTGGGRNSYEAVDTEGIVWLIHCEQDNTTTELRISRK
ncbi:MAG: hypothetical protein QNK23_16250 [Crocinitomicaceae bacterium]|nr:hypothetical protein [Crocinitomicaceae bacterium]